jgi:hypothetical protein
MPNKYSNDAERVESRRESRRRWKKNNPEKVRESERIRMRNDGGGYGRRWRKEINPDSAKSAQLRRDYNIDIHDYRNILAEQNGVCAICKHPQRGNKYLHVDHDHTCCPGRKSCGKCIRGLLCWYDNQVLGMMNNNPARFSAAMAYLEKYQWKHGSMEIIGSFFPKAS